MGRIETHELRFVLQSLGDPLVQQRADLQRPRLPLREYGHQSIERPARIHDVLDKKDVLSLQPGLRIINEPYGPTRHHRISIARGHQKVDLQRTLNLPYQITQEDKASLEQPQYH